jgi:hypothetical protein
LPERGVDPTLQAVSDKGVRRAERIGKRDKETHQKARTPERLAGEVVKLDAEHGKVIFRATDGTTHEFQATKEVLQTYKVGDRIDATLRSAPGCK